MSGESSSQKPLIPPAYELLYWPGIPGRGEYVRLAFEAAGVSYNDRANLSSEKAKILMPLLDPNGMGVEGNPPIFAPPALRVPKAGKIGKSLLIHQTPTILSYLGPKLGMTPDDEAGQVHVSQIANTALDMSNETHDTHHPVAVMKHYEDQKEEALKKSKDFREHRIPKFFNYFERILKSNEEEGNRKYLVGDKLTYADTTVWHVVDGLYFAYPKEMAAREKEFPVLLKTFYPSFKEEPGIKNYLESGRRQPFSNGLFRHYPELDRQ